MTHGEPQQCPHCKATQRPLVVGECTICAVCSEDVNQTHVAYKPVQSITENNIVTCEKGHSYSFHTIEARNLKEEGVCQLCIKAEREAKGIVDVQVQVPLPYGLPVPTHMNDAAVDLLALKLTQELRPILLGKVVNPDYKGDANLKKRNEELEQLLSDAVSRGEELSHALRRFDAGNDDVQDRELRDTEVLKADYKKLLEEANEAYEYLWAFVDIVNDVPRHGSLMARAGEALDKARQNEGRLKDAHEEVEFLRRYGNKDCTAMADEALNEHRSKVNPS